MFDLLGITINEQSIGFFRSIRQTMMGDCFRDADIDVLLMWIVVK